MSSLPGRYIVTQFLSVCLALCVFPVKVLFDTSFGILGIVGSIIIDVVSILTGDAEDRKLNESVSKNNNLVSINGHRRSITAPKIFNTYKTTQTQFRGPTKGAI